MAKQTQTEYLELAPVINITAAEVTFFISGAAGQPPYRYVVPPGGTVQLAPGYCKPRPTSNPDIFLPSIVSQRTQGRVVAVDSEEARAYLEGRQATTTTPAPAVAPSAAPAADAWVEPEGKKRPR